MKNTFDPGNIPDLSGKVIFVTGGTAGLGRETVCALAKHSPAHIYFSGRDVQKATAIVDELTTTAPGVKLTFIECDHASLASVENAAQRFLAESQRLDILICNAGVIGLPPGLTEDGYEVHFGINHLAHALLVDLLLPCLLRAAEGLESPAGADARIVWVSSRAFRFHPRGGIAFAGLRTERVSGLAGAWKRYGQSKLANVLYASELARRYPGITTVSVHPGLVATGPIRNLSVWDKALVYMGSMWRAVGPAEGVLNQLWAATADREGIVNGAYYEPVGKPGRHDRVSQSAALAEELWDWTATELSRFRVGE